MKLARQTTFLIIVLVLLFILGFANVKIPKPIGVPILLLMFCMAVWFVLKNLKFTGQRNQLKDIFKEVADKLHLEQTKLGGADALIAPLFARTGLSGQYKNFTTEIKPQGQSYSPLGMPFVGLFVGYIGIKIEIGPVQVTEMASGVKKSGKALWVSLPEQLKAMPYGFPWDNILVEDNKLILKVSPKIPSADDIIRIINILIELAEKLNSQ